MAWEAQEGVGTKGPSEPFTAQFLFKGSPSTSPPAISFCKSEYFPTCPSGYPQHSYFQSFCTNRYI